MHLPWQDRGASARHSRAAVALAQTQPESSESSTDAAAEATQASAKESSETSAFLPEVFGPDYVARKERARAAQRQARIFTAIALICLVVGLAVIGYPYVLQGIDMRRQAQIADEVNDAVSSWPYPEAEEAIEAAQAYNATLAASGQPHIGEEADPFSSASGQSSANGSNDSASAQDTTYMSLLNASNDGVMGSVVIPKISLNLPIYHGTSSESLTRGSGHLYGTSLPVGGTDTHAVLTGHRGMVNALMFTRIDELVVGDDFYISVMGETLAYEVDAITVILPTEGTKYLRVRPGEDRVTLMTCTPYGVNTHRLLVSGHRVSMPQPAPYPQDARRDTKLIAWEAGLGTGVVTIAAWGVIRRRSRWMPVHHAAVWRRL
ncbi:class C sortase [Pseudoscardovia radai]|uniref:class C sortase n=1 Tax=Pseudoscardovia radai TaxID=987066 RepID=UPI00399315F2